MKTITNKTYAKWTTLSMLCLSLVACGPAAIGALAGSGGGGGGGGGETSVTDPLDPSMLDSTAPITNIRSSFSAPSATNQVLIEFEANEVSTFEMSIDGQAWIPAVSPLTLTALADGDHRLCLRATDAAGNLEETESCIDFQVDTEAPHLSLDLPSPTLLVEGQSFEIRGFVSDNLLLDTLQIDVQNLLVGGDPQDFSGQIGLAGGTENFSLQATDTAGNMTSEDIQLQSWPFLMAKPSQMLSLSENQLLVLDSARAALVSFDLLTGLQTVVAESQHSSGITLDSATAIALDSNRARVLLTQTSGNAIISIDLDTGERAILSSDSVASGPTMAAPSCIYVVPMSDTAYVGCTQQNKVVAVDLLSGDRTLVANNSIGSGVVIAVPQDLFVSQSENEIVLLDSSQKALFQIDPSNGNRTVISGLNVGSGPDLESPQQLVVDPQLDSYLVVDAQLRNLIRIEATGGNRSLIEQPGALGPNYERPVDLVLKNDNEVYVLDADRKGVIHLDQNQQLRSLLFQQQQGEGLAFSDPVSWAALESVGGVASSAGLVLDRELQAVVQLNLETAERVSLAQTNTNLSFSRPEDSSLACANDCLLVVDSLLQSVVEVDLSSGDRSEFSGPLAAIGPSFTQPVAIESSDLFQQIFVLDRGAGQIFSVQSANGNRNIISGAGVGIGPEFGIAVDFVVDFASSRAFVCDLLDRAIYLVDLTTGERQVLSSAAVGIGPNLSSPRAISYDDARQRLYVADHLPAQIISVDIATGERTLVAASSIGSGFVIQELGTLTYDPALDFLIATDLVQQALISIDLMSGQRAIISQ